MVRLSLIAKLRERLRPEPVYAHCDVPCGIFTPEPARIAARTVVKMVSLIQELERPGANARREEVWAYQNRLARCVATKEEHAQICKKELLILWTDYFKPDHLKAFPELHASVWKAAQLCSKNKQEVDAGAAKELQDAVETVASIFEKAEKVKK